MYRDPKAVRQWTNGLGRRGAKIWTVGLEMLEKFWGNFWTVGLGENFGGKFWTVGLGENFGGGL